MTPPKPVARPRDLPFWRHLGLIRRDILSAQPERLYRARMAEMRTPFFRSVTLNEPGLVREVLCARPADFPKSERVTEGLRPLLGRSVFVTNGEAWARQRRLIDPAFEGGRLREVFPALLAAAEAGAARLSEGPVEAEQAASHMAADAIFRALFSVPIEMPLAAEVYHAFRSYQRAQPLLNLAAFVPLPRWVPRGYRRDARRAAEAIRARIADLVDARAGAIAAGAAPDDLATRIMCARDPETGDGFTRDEMVDQVAIFFLAGHETSAAALAWALWLLATHAEAQARVAGEAAEFMAAPEFGRLKRLGYTRDVFRETLRLYPPVPMMVREASRQETFRQRAVARGAQIVLSPWHLHRNPRHWGEPDAFDPGRWMRDCPVEAYLPFSAGPRACPGAGFAMIEGPLFLAALLARFEVAPADGPAPVPVAHLTVRARDGIRVRLSERDAVSGLRPDPCEGVPPPRAPPGVFGPT